MARSVKKGAFVDHHLMSKVIDMQAQKAKKVIKTWSRRSTIIPDMVGLTFAVHNGRKFLPVFAHFSNSLWGSQGSRWSGHARRARSSGCDWGSRCGGARGACG